MAVGIRRRDFVQFVDTSVRELAVSFDALLCTPFHVAAMTLAITFRGSVSPPTIISDSNIFLYWSTRSSLDLLQMNKEGSWLLEIDVFDDLCHIGSRFCFFQVIFMSSSQAVRSGLAGDVQTSTPKLVFFPSPLESNLRELSFPQQSSKWVTKKFSFERHDRLIDMMPSFGPLVSWYQSFILRGF